MRVRGFAIKLGDDIDTDVILPGKYLVLTDPNELAKHALEGLDPSFPKRLRIGTIIIAGKNFGCGSSREHAPIALKYAGVRAIIAKSFARIFYRNAINVGLPIAECRNIYDITENGDIIELDIEKGIVRNITKNAEFNIPRPPELVLNILRCGGLVRYLKYRISKS